jgi:ABC-type sugar transport system ATPase subunit
MSISKSLTASSSLFVVPSGCGKSTLLHIVSGVIGATEGRVTFEGR